MAELHAVCDCGHREGLHTFKRPEAVGLRRSWCRVHVKTPSGIKVPCDCTGYVDSGNRVEPPEWEKSV